MRSLTLAMDADARAKPFDAVADRLAALGRPAYALAVRCLAGRGGAEDVVQQAYLDALEFLRGNPPPENERAWFLKVVANAARMHLRSEAARRRREVVVQAERSTDPGIDAELVARLGEAMNALDAKYRLPVALCCEQGLSQREAAEVLEMPESTVSKYVNAGLERLRASLSRSGYAAAPAAVMIALGQTAPELPTALGAAIGRLLSGGAAVQGSGAAPAAAVAKGGIAMKIVAGLIAAGVLAGAGALGLSAFGFRHSEAPAAGLNSPPTAGGLPPTGTPAPVNDYKGMQDREEVFEFAEKPKVAKDGEKWAITFTSKGKCDATVTILDKDGKVVRHLASGVLGKNAPHPFKQDSLSQKIEWDGLTDGFKKADAAGCKVRVSLGLQAKFERNIGYDPYAVMSHGTDTRVKEASPVMLGAGPDGSRCVVATASQLEARLYDKDWKYLKTVFPPSAADAEKVLGVKESLGMNQTTWGDKVVNPTWFGPVMGHPGDNRSAKTVQERWPDLFRALKEAGVTDIKENVPYPPELTARSTVSRPMTTRLMRQDASRIAVDPGREEIYASLMGSAVFRFDGKTGALDATWFPNGNFTDGGELAFGPDGLLYVGRGGKATLSFRADHAGKPVPWKAVQNTVRGPKAKPDGNNSFYWGAPPGFQVENAFLVHGGFDGSNIHERGYDVSPAGLLASRVSQKVQLNYDPESANKVLDNRVTEKFAPEMKLMPGSANSIAVWDLDGNLVAWNAVEGLYHGHNLHVDRDGNFYVAQTVGLPGQKLPDGLASNKGNGHMGTATLFKFRGLGGKYPLGRFWGTNNDKTPPPAEAMKLTSGGASSPTAVTGALWGYFGLPCQSNIQDCTCHHLRNDLDGFSRPWILSNHLYSVMVLDSNGNRIARLGRYGNIDDNDPKCAGIHLCWPRSLVVSDTALYVHDGGNRRILKAALSYAAEETVPLP